MKQKLQQTKINKHIRLKDFFNRTAQSGNRRAQFGTLKSILLAVVVIIILVGLGVVLSKIMIRTSDITACQDSIQLSSFIEEKTDTPLGTIASSGINCPSHKETISEKTTYKAQQKITRHLTDCWKKTGQGKLSLFGDIDDAKYCLQCSSFVLKEGKLKESADGTRGIVITDMINHLEQNMPNQDETYLDFFAQKRVEGLTKEQRKTLLMTIMFLDKAADPNNEFLIKPLEKIDEGKEYVVVWARNPETYWEDMFRQISQQTINEEKYYPFNKIILEYQDKTHGEVLKDTLKLFVPFMGNYILLTTNPITQYKKLSGNYFAVWEGEGDNFNDQTMFIIEEAYLTDSGLCDVYYKDDTEYMLSELEPEKSTI